MHQVGFTTPSSHLSATDVAHQPVSRWAGLVSGTPSDFSHFPILPELETPKGQARLQNRGPCIARRAKQGDPPSSRRAGLWRVLNFASHSLRSRAKLVVSSLWHWPYRVIADETVPVRNYHDTHCRAAEIPKSSAKLQTNFIDQISNYQNLFGVLGFGYYLLFGIYDLDLPDAPHREGVRTFLPHD